jgi:biopolymer transport protein ExbB
MAGIAEALVATAVGLLVAIPAVVAYNVFKGMVKDSVTNTDALSRVLMAELKSASKSS